MARLFNVEVFNKTVSVAASPNQPKYYTGEEFSALLGSADTYCVQTILDTQGSAVTGPVLRVTLQINNSNEPETWETTAFFVDVAASATSPVSQSWVWAATGSNVRFLVQSLYSNVAVRIIVCGRSI